METQRRRTVARVLAVFGVLLFALGFLTQECSMSNPVPPATTAPPTCTRPAFPLVLLFWLPAAVVALVGVGLRRRARATASEVVS